jgi:hypothetical protein
VLHVTQISYNAEMAKFNNHYIYIYIKKEEATVDTIGTKLCHVNFMEYLYNICVVYSITLYFKYLGFLI